MQHLDRQVHAIHCSFLPGAGQEIARERLPDGDDEPLQLVLPRDAVGRDAISLWALAVFAFLAYRAALMLWRGRTSSGETKVLLAAAALPVLTSVVYGAIAVHELDALCKVCIGIYAASAICFAGALLAHRAQRVALVRRGAVRARARGGRRSRRGVDAGLRRLRAEARPQDLDAGLRLAGPRRGRRRRR